MNASNHQLKPSICSTIHPPKFFQTAVYPFMHPHHTNHSNHKFLLNLKLFLPTTHSLRFWAYCSHVCVYVGLCACACVCQDYKNYLRVCMDACTCNMLNVLYSAGCMYVSLFECVFLLLLLFFF